MLVAGGLAAVLGAGLVVVGLNVRGDAASTRDRVGEIRRQIAEAEEARETAVAAADSTRKKAESLERNRDDLDARMKRLSATVQDSVRASNRLVDDCFGPFASNKASAAQALACLPDRMKDNEAAVDAEVQAVADVRSALAAVEGEFSD